MATAEQIHELVTKMAQERAALLAQVQQLSEAAAERAPAGQTGEAEWTVKEQLAHLCQMELTYDAWVAAALMAENPDVTHSGVPTAAIRLEDANAHPIAELLAILEAERQDTLALIARLEPAQFERTATVERFGTLTVLQWLRSFYRHDRMHSAQIAGRVSPYRPRYVVGAEPDRRRPGAARGDA